MVDVAGAERHVDQDVGGLGRITLVPVRLTEPVADLDRPLVFLRLQAATTEERAIIAARNGIDALADLAAVRASHEVGCVSCRVGMRHAGHHGGDVRIVGEMGKGVDVFLVRSAQNQSLRQ